MTFLSFARRLTRHTWFGTIQASRHALCGALLAACRMREHKEQSHDLQDLSVSKAALWGVNIADQIRLKLLRSGVNTSAPVDKDEANRGSSLR